MAKLGNNFARNSPTHPNPNTIPTVMVSLTLILNLTQTLILILILNLTLILTLKFKIGGVQVEILPKIQTWNYQLFIMRGF